MMLINISRTPGTAGHRRNLPSKMTKKQHTWWIKILCAGKRVWQIEGTIITAEMAVHAGIDRSKKFTLPGLIKCSLLCV